MRSAYALHGGRHKAGMLITGITALPIMAHLCKSPSLLLKPFSSYLFYSHLKDEGHKNMTCEITSSLLETSSSSTPKQMFSFSLPKPVAAYGRKADSLGSLPLPSFILIRL